MAEQILHLADVHARVKEQGSGDGAQGVGRVDGVPGYYNAKITSILRIHWKLELGKGSFGASV
jgi:hypothetical protein